MSACLPVSAVPSLTEYSTNGMDEGKGGGGEERDVLQTLSRCISMSSWGRGGNSFSKQHVKRNTRVVTFSLG